MNIFKKKKGKLRIIYHSHLPLVDLPGQIVGELEIGTGCNLFNSLMAVAKIKADGLKYFACVKRRRYIEIYYRSKSFLKIAGKFVILVTRIDGDYDDPKKIKNIVKKAIKNSENNIKKACEKEMARLLV
jgi:hypothetical protein